MFQDENYQEIYLRIVYYINIFKDLFCVDCQIKKSVALSFIICKSHTMKINFL